MEKTRVVQFKIPRTAISYSLKLEYDTSGVLRIAERQEIRKGDRPIEFRMLNQPEKNIFMEHYSNKINSLPVLYNK